MVGKVEKLSQCEYMHYFLLHFEMTVECSMEGRDTGKPPRREKATIQGFVVLVWAPPLVSSSPYGQTD